MAYPIEEGDRLYPLFCQILIVCLGGYFFYSFPRWRHLVTSIRAVYFEDTPAEVPGTPKAGVIPPGKEPHVTVAICSYNEGKVVLKTIEHACLLDWPQDKLTVHVYDDSTDQLSIQLIEQSVSFWKEKGVNVARLTRPDRVGYKAGNLRYNFSRIKGEFVAYFDADHRPEKDFLRNTVPYFYHRSGETNPKIALVQTPWAYYNTHQNILTECDSFGLDIHHVCEQVGRSINYRLFGFNGTGGIWRKQAVADAGGFTWETITEDLLLSYRAYMKGYELLYVRHFPQCLEVPADILAHVQQKHRWTKGFLQVFRIFRWTLIMSPKVPFLVTYEFFSHVLGSVQLVFYATTLILYPHLKIPALLNSWAFKLRFLTAALDATFTAVHGQTSKVPASNGHYSSLGSRMMRILLYVPYCTLQMGMTPFEARAALEGLWSDDATFLTTPKKGSRTKACKNRVDDLVAYLGLLIALHQIVFSVRNDPFADVDSIIIRNSMRFWNVCFVIGLVCVSGSFLLAKYRDRLRGQMELSTSSPVVRMTLTAVVAAALAHLNQA